MKDQKPLMTASSRNDDLSACEFAQAGEVVSFSDTSRRNDAEMAVSKGFPKGRTHSAHLLRYGSSMMGLRHVSRCQASHLNQMETADHQIRVVSLLAGNRLYKYKGHNDDESDLYAYDSAHRLIDFQRGTLVEPDRDSISGTPVTEEDWTLDELYNWNSWTKDSQTENRTHNLANELTARDSQSLTYDGKGNLTEDGTYEYEWDKFNRLIKVSSGSTLLAEYLYDAGNRRIAKTVYNGGSSQTTEFVLSVNWQILEEYVEGTLEKTYVYGLYIDEPILMEDNLGDTYYYCHDAQYSVTAMLDDAGQIVERYEYTPYGKTNVFTDPGTDLTWFTGDDEYAAANEVGNPYRFTGRRFDSESGMYYFRNRMWSGEMGRFVSRDPASYIDGMNLYAGWFVVNNTDPQGNQTKVDFVEDKDSIQSIDNTKFGFEWNIRFIIDPPHTGDGIWLQNVKITINVWHCKQPEKQIHPFPFKLNFVEAFNKASSTFSEIDVWTTKKSFTQNLGAYGSYCTFGILSIEGYAYFFKGLNMNNLPKSWKQGSGLNVYTPKSIPSGGAKSTTYPPDLPKGYSWPKSGVGPVVRKLTESYIWCKKGGKPEYYSNIAKPRKPKGGF